jgi:hypothetical protein
MMLQGMQVRLRGNYDLRLNNEKLGRQLRYEIPLFQGLIYRICLKALEKTWEQYKYALDVLNGEREGKACQGLYAHQYGLPCWHTIYRLHEEDSALSLRHFDQHWHLDLVRLWP